MTAFILFLLRHLHPLSQPASPPYDEATWESVWQIVGGMQGLRDLRVHICYCTVEARIFEPPKAVHGPDIFEVKVPWKGEYEFNAPFKITRPEIE